MVLAEKGGLNCLCHTPACQLDPHDKAGCRTDHPKDRLALEGSNPHKHPG